MGVDRWCSEPPSGCPSSRSHTLGRASACACPPRRCHRLRGDAPKCVLSLGGDSPFPFYRRWSARPVLTRAGLCSQAPVTRLPSGSLHSLLKNKNVLKSQTRQKKKRSLPSIYLAARKHHNFLCNFPQSLNFEERRRRKNIANT